MVRYNKPNMQLSKIAVKLKPSEPVWHVRLIVLIAIALQLSLQNDLAFGSKYAVAGLELILLVLLSIGLLSEALQRLLAIGFIGIISAANIVSLGLVINALFTTLQIDGRQLLISSVAIYLTNIIVFGLLYWEMDNTRQDVPDFDFPQFNDGRKQGWQPTFFDYLYVSITNASAFSPTDTMPLTHRAKLLMTVQALASLVTVALVAARAVNILS